MPWGKIAADYNSVTDSEQISVSGLWSGFSGELGAMLWMRWWGGVFWHGPVGNVTRWSRAEESESWRIISSNFRHKEGKEKRWQVSRKKKGSKMRSDGGVWAPTFLDFLRRLFLLDELGRFLWKFQLLPVAGHFSNGLNTPWVTGRGNTSAKWSIS